MICPPTHVDHVCRARMQIVELETRAAPLAARRPRCNEVLRVGRHLLYLLLREVRVATRRVGINRRVEGGVF